MASLGAILLASGCQPYNGQQDELVLHVDSVGSSNILTAWVPGTGCFEVAQPVTTSRSTIYGWEPTHRLFVRSGATVIDLWQGESFFESGPTEYFQDVDSADWVARWDLRSGIADTPGNQCHRLEASLIKPDFSEWPQAPSLSLRGRFSMSTDPSSTGAYIQLICVDESAYYAFTKTHARWTLLNESKYLTWLEFNALGVECDDLP